jgi:hypothetical protein
VQYQHWPAGHTARSKNLSISSDSEIDGNGNGNADDDDGDDDLAPPGGEGNSKVV